MLRRTWRLKRAENGIRLRHAIRPYTDPATVAPPKTPKAPATTPAQDSATPKPVPDDPSDAKTKTWTTPTPWQRRR
jgi:hypothetical protein